MVYNMLSTFVGMFNSTKNSPLLRSRNIVSASCFLTFLNKIAKHDETEQNLKKTIRFHSVKTETQCEYAVLFSMPI